MNLQLVATQRFFCFFFTPTYRPTWGNDPIWRTCIFFKWVGNYQLDMVVALKWNKTIMIDPKKLMMERIDMSNAQKPVLFFCCLGEYTRTWLNCTTRYPVVNIFGLLWGSLYTENKKLRDSHGSYSLFAYILTPPTRGLGSAECSRNRYETMADPSPLQLFLF